MSDETGDLTHFNAQGQAHMVDVGDKSDTQRVALASGAISMQAQTLARVQAGTHQKGDVLGIARIAGIMGAKKAADLIPLCHPLALTHVSVQFECHEAGVEAGAGAQIVCVAQVETRGKTGVEMEALAAVQIALLTIYDMCKAMDKSMVMGQIQVDEKRGGRSGHYQRV